MAELTLSQDRQNLLLQAVYELDKLARVAPTLVPVDEDQAHYAIKGICGRMVRLTGVLLTGIADVESIDDQSLKEVLDFSATGQG